MMVCLVVIGRAFWTFLRQVEDIVDTGSTVACLVEHLKSKGATSVSVCTFLDKPARRKVQFELVGQGKFYAGFEVGFIPLFFFPCFPSLNLCIIRNNNLYLFVYNLLTR